MKAMGLQVGDKVKINGVDIFKIERNKYEEPFLKLLEGNEVKSFVIKGLKSITMSCLVNMEYEILPRPKRVGNLKCDDFECNECPLKYICTLKDWGFATNDNLFDILELFKCDDQEIYDLLKARLDKEVLE